MTSSNDTSCVAANPDIAGYGVMVAITAQAASSFVAPLLSITDGKLTPEENKRISSLPIVNSIYLCSLVVTGIVQAAQNQLSAYHGIMILNMAWELEGYLILSHHFIDHGLGRWFHGGSSAMDVVQAGSVMSVMLSISRIVLGAWGVTLSVLTFARKLTCVERTVIVIVHRGWVVRMGDPRAQIACGILNGLRGIFGFFSLARDFRGARPKESPLGKRGTRRHKDWHELADTECPNSGGEDRDKGDAHATRDVAVNRWVIAFRGLGAFIFWVCLVITTYTTRSRNIDTKVVSEGENDWGYGQILALCLVAHPVLLTIRVRAVREWIRARCRRKAVGDTGIRKRESEYNQPASKAEVMKLKTVETEEIKSPLTTSEGMRHRKLSNMGGLDAPKGSERVKFPTGESTEAQTYISCTNMIINTYYNQPPDTTNQGSIPWQIAQQMQSNAFPQSYPTYATANTAIPAVVVTGPEPSPRALVFGSLNNDSEETLTGLD